MEGERGGEKEREKSGVWAKKKGEKEESFFFFLQGLVAKKSFLLHLIFISLPKCK